MPLAIDPYPVLCLGPFIPLTSELHKVRGRLLCLQPFQPRPNHLTLPHLILPWESFLPDKEVKATSGLHSLRWLSVRLGRKKIQSPSHAEQDPE